MLCMLLTSCSASWGKHTAFLEWQRTELAISCPIKGTPSMEKDSGNSLQKGSAGVNTLNLSVARQLQARRTPTRTSATLSPCNQSDLLSVRDEGGRIQSLWHKKILPKVHVNYKTVSVVLWSSNWWEIKKNKAVKMIITKEKKKKSVWVKVGKSASRMTTVLENYWALFIKAVRQEC